ncbi:MAG: winged helix-turn-helix transcriptional regulator [Syntrophomonadaceae bacterium]|nr:winged helix-turn-helix transcriptional regulator [Syntrophomonadaceae bacterium]
MELVQVMRALGDENRLRILNLLRKGNLNVGELEQILGINQSNVSRHLNRLRQTNLIIHEKRAQWVYYRINNSMLHKYPLLNEILNKELDKIEQCIRDLDALKQYRRKLRGIYDEEPT